MKINNLFSLPQPKSKEDMFREKIRTAMAEGKMVSYGEYREFYFDVHASIFGSKPEGNNRMSSVKDAINAFYNLGLTNDILLEATPIFLRGVQPHLDWHYLSFKMIVDQHNSKHFKEAADWAREKILRGKQK